MNLKQIRNATIIVEYAGKRFLVDPMLSKKGALLPIPHTPLQENNPLHDLPMSVEDIITGIDAVIVTHLHEDHWDDAAKKVLPKDIKLFVQNKEDAGHVRNDGFLNVEIMKDKTVFEGIQLIKTKGEHGRGEYVELLGNVSGVVFKHLEEKTLYVAGDTVWYKGVQEELNMHNPDVIVVNSGANQFIELESGPIIMDKEDVYEVYKAAPRATIVCVHMEAVNHWGLSRETLKIYANDKGFSSHVLIPDDGESYRL